MEKPQGRKAYRIVLVPYPFQGHINPMLQLGTVLHSEGFSITVVHPQFNSPNPSNHPDFTFKPISDGLSPSADFMTSLSVLNTKCRVSFLEAMKQLTDEKVDDKIICIIFDGLMYFTQQVAAQLKIPAISLRTSSAASVLAFAVNRGPNQQGHIPFQGNDLMSLDESTELNILLKNLPKSHIEHTNKVILEARAMITDALRSSAVIVNTMDHLEQTSLTKVQKRSNSAHINNQHQISQPFTEHLKQFMEQKGPDHDRIMCINYDGIKHFSEAAAHHLNLPSIIRRTSSTATILAYAAFPLLREGHILV
ncbi:hypothetical protein RJ641_008754 [Dillenia turbinata]|uniref:Uncharacterized protein n=1 Tax=Dillenia turbinata TaxID=194707 RepID=A0AAN8V3W7_9MAGN